MFYTMEDNLLDDILLEIKVTSYRRIRKCAAIASMVLQIAWLWAIYTFHPNLRGFGRYSFLVSLCVAVATLAIQYRYRAPKK